MEPGVYILPRPQLLTSVADLPEATKVCTLPLGIASKSEFFDAACDVLPMNPPLMRITDSWDALDDSLGGGLLDVEEPWIAIAWEDPDALAAADPESGRIAVEILSALPLDLLSPKFNAGITKRVVVLLGDVASLG
jgi:Barstar (barnase inhibitor)